MAAPKQKIVIEINPVESKPPPPPPRKEVVIIKQPDEEEEEDEDEDEYEYFDDRPPRYPLNKICLLCIALILILILLVACILFVKALIPLKMREKKKTAGVVTGGGAGPDEEEGFAGVKYFGFHGGSPTAFNSNPMRVNFVEAQKRCKDENRRLVTITNQQQEDEFFKILNNEYKEMSCQRFFLGYKMKGEPSFKSIPDGKPLPPLDQSLESLKINPNSHCFLIDTRPLKVIEGSKPCEGSMFNCVMGAEYKNPDCKKNPWHIDCIGYLINIPNRSIEDSETFFRARDRYFKGILAVDVHAIPTAVIDLMAQCTEPQCGGLAIRLERNYVNIYDSNIEFYNSSRMMSGEPSGDCLLVDIRSPPFKIVSNYCNFTACSFCG